MTETTLPQGRYTIAAYNDGEIRVPDVPGVPPAVRAAADKAADRVHGSHVPRTPSSAPAVNRFAPPRRSTGRTTRRRYRAGKPLPNDRRRAGRTRSVRGRDPQSGSVRPVGTGSDAQARRDDPRRSPRMAAGVGSRPSKRPAKRALATLDRLAELLDELAQETAIRDALEAFPQGGSLHGVQFQPAQGRGRIRRWRSGSTSSGPRRARIGSCSDFTLWAALDRRPDWRGAGVEPGQGAEHLEAQSLEVGPLDLRAVIEDSLEIGGQIAGAVGLAVERVRLDDPRILASRLCRGPGVSPSPRR